MCGIAGSIAIDRYAADDLRAIALSMGDAIRHRGPDDSGLWYDAEIGIVFSHRRLAILDLSGEGRQPMHSANGRFVIAFNGEIYNYRQIQEELSAAGRAVHWRGHSDTEVMLAAIEHWGVNGAVERFNGMFAFALWDRSQRQLTLCRDRAGEKPLYYGWSGGTFLFGSELKALRAHPAFSGKVDRNALCLLMRYNCIPAPYSIYVGIRKLEAGAIATLTWDHITRSATPEVERYWSPPRDDENDAVWNGRDAEQLAASQLEDLLRDSIRMRMHADVPLGAFLSGGVDSSLVVALMQAQSSRPIRTYSIGLQHQGDEAPYARAVAECLGTEHTELYVEPRQALELIPQLATIYDEPFADSSQIPTRLVSALARSEVTVTLSGDAGDELFGGYNRHVWGGPVYRLMRRVPIRARRVAARAITHWTPDNWNAIAGGVGAALPVRWRIDRPGDQLHKLAAILQAGDPSDVYRVLVSHWAQPERVVLGATEPEMAPTGTERRETIDYSAEVFVRSIMDLDFAGYLADDILTKVDRASMSVGLEARVPFLDPRVIEFARRLPLSFLIRAGRGKFLLRSILARYVPMALIDRPKMGFGIPIDVWLRGALRPWAEDLLDPTRLQQQGYFDARLVTAKWHEHLSGSRNWSYLLWDVLMFQAWLEEST